MERLPGFRDFLPAPPPDAWSFETRFHIFSKWRQIAHTYGFKEFDGPPLEPLELYTVKSGDEIVGQLYNFTDKGGREVALRPEMTPTLARIISTHERHYKKPIKWFSIPQLFRYERQQRGRLREHFQLNADIIGESDPAADAELIALLIDCLRCFSLTPDDFVIRLSSRKAWESFFAQHCPDSDKASTFYQIIDKLERESPEHSESKLAAIGVSLKEVRQFIDRAEPTPELEEIVRNLSARGLASFVKIDYNVIRGLAYYTGAVFEAFDKKGQFRAIAGGGRYDNLIKLISGNRVNLPAIGFGMGDVVLLELLKERKLVPPGTTRPDAFCLIESDAIRPDALGIIQLLRQEGFAIEYSLTQSKSDKQFKRATELQARWVITPQRAATGELVVQTKHLGTREEKTMLPTDLPLEFRRHLIEEP